MTKAWLCLSLILAACGGAQFEEGSGNGGGQGGAGGGAGSPHGGSAGVNVAGDGDTSEAPVGGGGSRPMQPGGGSAGTHIGGAGGSSGAAGESSAGAAGAAPMACDPGTARCADGSFETCEGDGSGWTSEACDHVCDVKKGCVGECSPGERKCAGLTSLTCDEAGTWLTTTTCPFLCTGDGTCTGQCSPDEHQCSGKDIQVCDHKGAWVTSETCQFICNASAGSASCGGSCTSGTKQCSGKTPQTCTSDQWVSGAACPFLCTGGSCAGECVPGSQRCGAQGGIQTCSPQAVWLQEGPPCPFTCSNGACSGVCVPNAACTDDGNSCTDDVCNSSGTACTHPPRANGSACGSSSTSACDNADSCQNGTCQANPKPAGTACTNDNNPCTTDACNGAGTCTHNAAPANTVCRTASCSNGVVTAQATCGGSTTCPAASTSQCYGACNEAANACENPAPTKVDDGEAMAIDSDATYIYASVRLLNGTSQIVRYAKSNNAKVVLFESTDPTDWLSSLIVAGNYVYFGRVGADNVTGKVWMIQTSGVKQAGLQVSTEATFGFAKNSTRVYWSTARRYTCVCSNPATINVYSVEIGGTTPTKYTRNFNGMEMSPDIEVDDTNLYVWEMGIQWNGPQVSQVYSPFLMAYSLADHQVWTQIQGSYFIESGITYTLAGTNSAFPGITKQGSTIYGNANLAPINSPMQISSDNLIFRYTGATTRLTRKSPVGLSSKFAADATNIYIENMRIPVGGGSMSYWTNHQLGAITLDTNSVYFMSFGYWNELPYQGNLDATLSALMRVSK